MEGKVEKRFEEKLKTLFKFETFKSEYQLCATLSVMVYMTTKNSDVLINLPSGAGKSICFQLPTMLQEEKITIVIVPDEYTGEEQISFLTEHQIKTFYVHSKTQQIDIPEFLEEVVEKMNLKFIYVTANMVKINWFQILMKEMNALGLIVAIVIDEVHCISEHYGRFTQSYREIYKLRDVLPHPPFIALTSVGTRKIMIDVNDYLQLKSPFIFSCPNWQLPQAYLQVRFKDVLSNPLNDMKNFIKNFMDTSEKFSGIIFCSNSDEAVEVAQQLTGLGIPTAAYCSGLEEYERNENEQDWTTGKITMLTTTDHFRMELSKYSVRCIIHWSIPWRIEQYYELIKKYTRFNKPIHCRLYFSLKDWADFQMIAMNMSNQIFNEFSKIIDYCMSISCRHVFISKYFGSKLHSCDNACDSCEDGLSVQSRQYMFQEIVWYQKQSFSKIKNLPTPTVFKISQTDKVKNLTSLQRIHQYENLKSVLSENYENSCCENKPEMKTEDLHLFAKKLEFSIFSTSYKKQEYFYKVLELITRIENSTKSKLVSDYIVNYKIISSKK